MLRVDQLRVPGLGPVSFSLAAGECLAIMGPSGSGKTRLLRAIADLDVVPGHVFLEGAERAEMTGPAWRAAVRYLAAEPGWWGATPRAERWPARVAPDKLRRQLLAVGLAAAVLERSVAALSTGERQRLAVLRALADEPRVLLLDEPTAALDAEAAGLVEELIRFQCLSGAAVALVSHDAAQVRRLAGRVLVLEAGSVRLETGPTELRS